MAVLKFFDLTEGTNEQSPLVSPVFLNATLVVYIAELGEVPVPGQIPSGWVPTLPPPTVTSTAGQLGSPGKMTIQNDQQLLVWWGVVNQTGLLPLFPGPTNNPPSVQLPFEWRFQLFYEVIGPGEWTPAGVIGIDTPDNLPFFHRAGFNGLPTGVTGVPYGKFFIIPANTFGTMKAKVYAHAEFGHTNPMVPHTVINSLIDLMVFDSYIL